MEDFAMGVRRRHFRESVLAVLIGLGLCVNSGKAKAAETEVLTLAGGCFWCVESDFESVKGVTEVVSGYTGGHVRDPSYKQVTRGGTGHYEAVQIHFDPDFVGRKQLLHMFFCSVDPTDGGGQFCDRGDSYRTAIFVADDKERALAKSAISRVQEVLGQKVVTPILPLSKFFAAEDYHQDYYKGRNIVITRFGPKRQSEAYKRYRKACGRDARVRELWGDLAPFAGHY